MFARVPLERVADNPFQTRRDYGDLGDLAQSLLDMQASRPETSGLIQVPPGRIVVGERVLDPAEYGGVLPCLGDEPGAVVELAAGHRRRAAFQRLYEAQSNGDYATFPVAVQVLDDQAMADIAWEENARRKDLNAIEEAQALRRAMERFGWTQAEVGRRWGLSQSAVANKLRLLQLPPEAQQAIRRGALSERHGRALLKAAGKSERIYRRVAEEVIPLAVEPETAEKARSLVEADRYYRWENQDVGEAKCEACGSPACSSVGDRTYTCVRDGQRVYVCLACYRAATGWEPPSTARTEGEVDRAIRSESRSLDRATWPPDVVVGDGDARVQSARCEGCALREDGDGRDMCLDRGCFSAKEEHWFSYRVNQLYSQVQRDFGAVAAVTDGYGGCDLRAHSDVDVALVREGICAPGKCERLRFRHVTYEASSLIRPYPDLPFIYNCNNANSHGACVRRYLKAQRTDDEKAAEKSVRRAAEARRRQAQTLIDRAAQSVGRALLDGHAGAWGALATRVTGQAPKNGQATGDLAAQVAEHMIDGNHMLGSWMDFEGEDSLGAVEDILAGRLSRMGVGMLPAAGDLVRQLERISGFVLDEEGHVRSDLTPAQVRGNVDNLDEVRAQVAAMGPCPGRQGQGSDGRASAEDVERISGWARELGDALATTLVLADKDRASR